MAPPGTAARRRASIAGAAAVADLDDEDETEVLFRAAYRAECGDDTRGQMEWFNFLMRRGGHVGRLVHDVLLGMCAEEVVRHVSLLDDDARDKVIAICVSFRHSAAHQRLLACIPPPEAHRQMVLARLCAAAARTT